MFGATEENPFKQAPHQAVTSPSNLESLFRLYLIAPGSVFLLPARRCGRAGVRVYDHAHARGACARARVRARSRVAALPGVACGRATMRMHTAGVRAGVRGCARAGV